MEGPTRFSKQSDSNELVKASEVRTPGAKPEFNSGNIREFIDNRGARVLWEMSWLCTCRNPNTLAPDSSCPICKGRGVGFMAPEEIRVAIQSQEKGVNNMDLGLYDSGTAIGTTTIGSNVGYRDRLTLPDVALRQSVIFDVTERRVKNGVYLTYDVKEITHALGVNGQPLSEWTDYTFDEKTNMFYPKEHLIGTNVSLNMLTQLRYYVIDFLKESRYQYTELNRGKENALYESYPKKLLLKREDIFVPTEIFSGGGGDIDKRAEERTGGQTTIIEKPANIEDGTGYIDHVNPYLDIEKTRPGSGGLGGFFGGKLNG